MEKRLSGGSQAFLIFILAIVVGLTINATSAKRVSFFTDYTEKMKADNTDSLTNAIKSTNDFKNNPYDTTKKSQPLSYNNNPNLTKDGYIRPQKIKLELAKLLYEKNALMIDARKVEEFNAGHIKGAINIPLEEFAYNNDTAKLSERMKGLNKDGIIICYCNGGDCDMSIDLAYAIAKLGFNATNIYLGGYKEWQEAGLPVQK